MKLFLDTASIEEIRTANRWGVLGGVTTNPSLLAREHAAPETVWKEILTEVHGDVSLEVTALDADGMVEQGHALAQMGPNAVVKVPMTPDGLEAASRLRDGEHPHEHHAGVLCRAGDPGRRGRRLLRLAVPRTARRCRRRRHGGVTGHL